MTDSQRTRSQTDVYDAIRGIREEKAKQSASISAHFGVIPTSNRELGLAFYFEFPYILHHESRITKRFPPALRDCYDNWPPTIIKLRLAGGYILLDDAGVAELVDAADSKSAGVYPHAGSSPALGTKQFPRSLTQLGEAFLAHQPESPSENRRLGG
jgi:hypothetical protein